MTLKGSFNQTRQCSAPVSGKDDAGAGSDCPITYFKSQVRNCLDYARLRKKEGAKIVGIMCEYTPREIIMAAGGVPVCLCGGSLDMIEPAEKILPSNLCPLIKSTFGYSIEKANPFLEMSDLIVAETTCDGKKKMYELLAEDRQMHVLELPQKPDDHDSLEHWVAELKKLKNILEDRFSTEITDEKLRYSIRLMNRERKLRMGLADLMKSESPILTGRELLDMKSLISCMPLDLEQYERAPEILKGRTPSLSTDSPVRVLVTGVPTPHGAERVIDIIEKNGGMVVCQENCTGIKPLQEMVNEDAPDPLRAIAEKYFHLPCALMTRNTARIEKLRKLAAEFKVDCVIELVWQACITYDVESSLVRRMVEDELGLPYLHIETDYSPSDTARIALRVQAIFETVKGKRPCCAPE